MDIIGGIGAATEGLKLINELRKIDKELDKADLKLRLVELADKLLDAKKALQSAQETEFALRSEIQQLTAKLATKPRLEDVNGLLYELDEEGQRVGKPYCNQCFVKEDRMYRLVETERAAGYGYVCNNCDTLIITQKKPRPQPSPSRGGTWGRR
jgi:hypothetical protein